MVECLSDNRNRTGAEIRNVFSKNGGSMAEPGAVSWQFERKGIIAVPRTFDEDRVLEVVMEAGAEDLADDGERWLVTSGPSELTAVHAALEEAGLEPGPSELTMVPTTTVEVATESEAKKVLRLDRGTRRPRRRAERLRQFRHPRRGDGLLRGMTGRRRRWIIPHLVGGAG